MSLCIFCREHEPDYWQPGEVLPITPQTPTAPVQDSATVMDVLQGFQASMEKQLSSIGGQLGDIHDRIDTLESRQITLEKEVQCSSSTPTSIPGKGRKRVTPTALQVNYPCYICVWYWKLHQKSEKVKAECLL